MGYQVKRVEKITITFETGDTLLPSYQSTGVRA